MLPLATEFTIYHPTLPLAVYRELAAHVRQILGVEVSFVEPQTQTFSYQDSQVAGLAISCPDDLSALDRTRLSDILTYYADRYGQFTRG